MPIRKCAVCGRESNQDSFSVLGPGGPPDLDTRPSGEIRATLDRWVEHCPACGFAASEIEHAFEGVAELVTSPEFPRTAHPFARQSWLLEQLGLFADAGWSELHLAWHNDDAGDALAASKARLRAISLWKQGKTLYQNFGESEAEEFALAADLYRRAGLMDDARETCLAGLELDDLPPIIDDLLRFQLTLVQRADRAVHTLAELPAAPEKGLRLSLD